MSAAVEEGLRVRELHRLTDPAVRQSAAVEDLVERAAVAAGVPMATLNLLDADTQWQPATSGFAGTPAPRSEAMCDVTLRLGGPVHVSDASADPRFADSPWVDGRLGNVRFYASVPLRTSRDLIIGTLCTFDIEPHSIDDAQVRQLEQLASELVDTLESEADARD
ncbi:GAF domain-containing protein [Motilibacter aurantiacus]|uniref:GAF domain-containing protein n=1 Tax=Motilibacter aurantiacus TaxID=2714955 RepID=UPI0014088860|nr:GAF domain-containing protein [Motilibacter aurantiacus]NHC46674.1 GAF domain-containing protein [Motilibacter aurantiacus]